MKGYYRDTVLEVLRSFLGLPQNLPTSNPFTITDKDYRTKIEILILTDIYMYIEIPYSLRDFIELYNAFFNEYVNKDEIEGFRHGVAADRSVYRNWLKAMSG